MRNVPLVCDSRLLFAEWFKRVSWLAYGLVYIIAFNDFLASYKEAWASRIGRTCMEHKPPYLWLWQDDTAITGHLYIRDREKFLNELRRWKI